ncbi:PREDICTED: venom dipeptidyl peptidase 4-like isoform X1 [Papilio xuthus]|uniref:Venom dipeptidyl peptidase 4 n=2 Tax=Papilio xuthus TaxID=66420 RepID=A0AAJ6YZ28_PAPXU|nr:PREDICTED: venom dipeptidyl peptidase 4-like isoform X1 [Papilio xuthus]XP_013161752.1 PREDICTED: venom dipeptidyl peptidase 4-like isoform X1 [Papilio xuthus]XP_013161754.1 PREDICTED: venom dipeptidyl peptidase 4-like isoform X1 [Papilio xuthus]
MAQENSNSTLEMGTSDQVLVATKKKKTLTYIIGFIAMVAVIAVVITLVVVLSGNEAGPSEPIVSTTEGPTSPLDPSTTTTTTTTTTTPPVDPTTTTLDPSTTTTTTTTTTEGPITAPPDTLPIDLEDIINGVFAAPSFNGTWTTANDVLFRNLNGDLVLYHVDADDTTVLISNSSQILQQSSRVTALSSDSSHVVLSYNVVPVYRYSFLGRYAAVNISSGQAIDIVPPGVRPEEAFLQNFVWGPSGTSLAFVYRNNIYYQASLDSQPQQITNNGEVNVIYNGIPDWVYEEEVFVSNNALWFARDGSKLAYATFDDTNVRVMKVPHFGVPGSVDYQYTQHHEIRYPKPGTTNPTVRVTLRDIASGTETVYNAPTDLNEPILKTVNFVDNDKIALMWTNRAQTSLQVELCMQNETSCSRIYQYSEPNGWIDNIPIFFNEAGNSFITILPQSVNGTLYKQIVQVSDVNANQWTGTGRTNTPHTVIEILLWTNNDVVWYKATHVDDSAEQHIYTVNAAREVTCFTCSIARADGGQCLYNDAFISADTSRVAINCAGPSLPQIFIYDVNGTMLKTWDDNAETSALLTDRQLPVTLRMSVPVAAGFPEADVQIQAPSDYLSRTNVPLLVYVYGGPDTALVTKQWTLDWGTSLVNRWGIAVAHIDGRGSGLRGIDNMFAINRRLGTDEIDDQVSVTRTLHQTLPWLDSNRTCIWGWSYGGYAASLALARGADVFRCAAAVAPVVDWRFYDTIYTERYMDTPQNNPQAYLNSSLLTPEVVSAYRSKRYFLIHGTADDNVHYQHAMLISRLLQREDVYFTQMSYTDEDHGLVGVRPHLYHALEKFLQENML